MPSGVRLTLDMSPAEPPPPAPPLPPAPAPYTVRLRDADLGQQDRSQVEERFRAALGKKLGSPNDVANLLRLLQEAEFLSRTLTDDEQALARKWQRAHLEARLIGLQGLAAMSGASLEVKAT